MKYYRNPINGDIVGHDPDTNTTVVCEKLSVTKGKLVVDQKDIEKKLKKLYLDEEIDSNPAYGRKDFSYARELKDQGLTSLEVAEKLKLPQRETNFVFQARTYDDYVRLFKLMK